MISLIKRQTGSNIVVGQNGIVWIQGGDENLATTVIKMVEMESHKEGLTDMIEKFLGEHAPKNVQPMASEQATAENMENGNNSGDDKITKDFQE